MNKFGLFVLIVAGLASVPSLGQEQQDPIRVDVDAVNLLVTVMDKQGRFVTDLPRERFLLFENGARQEITNFSHETNLPLNIGLLIDTSASVRTKLKFEKQAATNFVFSVMRPRDKTLLVEFDTGVTLISDFTSKPEAIARQIKNLQAGGGTAMMDAIYAVSRDKMNEPDARQALVIVSDGADRDSKRTIEEALSMAHRTNVIVYGIGTNRLGASGSKRGEDVLMELADKTGGRAYFPYSQEQLYHAFDQINAELRSQYSLTFTPIKTDKKKSNFRKLKVRIEKGGKYELRYRRGYYASSEPISD